MRWLFVGWSFLCLTFWAFTANGARGPDGYVNVVAAGIAAVLVFFIWLAGTVVLYFARRLLID